MEIQSLLVGTQTLASKFTPSLPPLKFSAAQSKLSNTPQKLECRIGQGKEFYFGNNGYLEFLSFSPSGGGRRIKPVRRSGLSLATKNNGQSLPEEENPEEKNEIDILEEKNELDFSGSVQALDWRAFRAKLFAAEQVIKSPKDDSVSGSEADSSLVSSIGSKWAHPLHEPEPGCVLVATEKQDGTKSFERTVILLLHVDAEGSFGVILNRPLHSSLLHRRPTHPDMATVFSNCPLYYGGPLEGRMFLVASKNKNAVSDAFEEVVPGLYYGGRDSLHDAAELVRSKVLVSENFRFFHGCCDWDLDQLKEEISFNFWHVAACSPDLMTSALSTSGADLWGEILQLMGDRYAALSRKPKQDSV